MKKLFFKGTLALFLSLIIIFTGMMKINKDDKPVYKDSAAPIDQRVNDLLSRMTLEEKIDMLGGTGFATKPNKRLGIPELRMTDGPLGVRWEKSSAFPGGIALASTWDTSMAHNIGAAIGREVKAHGRDVILGPCVNIARIPMGGRNFESFGEDPYLDSRMAVSYIKGVQSENVAATVKHFAANNQEYERMFVNVKLSERALNEIYLPAFKAAVKEAKVLCVMSAYNRLNGPFCSESDYLLKEKLRDDWDFKGLVMSDWGAVHSSLPTAQGGLDLEMPTGKYLNDSTLAEAVKNGELSEETINTKVKNILGVMFKLGLFDHPRKDNSALLNSDENKAIAYKGALEGIVLLKNENGILPLKEDQFKSLAVIGPNAAEALTGGGGSSKVSPIFSVSPLAALQKRLGDKVRINYAKGVDLEGGAAPIPPSSLFDPDKKYNGLKGEYFSNPDLKGEPAFVRTDQKLDFNWGDGSPREGFNKDYFSVRWTGYIQAPFSGKYVIDLITDDGVRLYFEDKLVINDWTDHAAMTNSYTVKLEGGKKYKIKIEYYEHGGGAIAKLSWRKPGEDPLGAAVKAASESDAAIIFAGTTDQYETEGKDRKDLVLPGKQDKLIQAVSKVNKNVIVVLTTGSPVLMDSWIGNVKGILETWFAGEEIGNAAVDVLFGDYNPSGKLPVTFPHKWEDCSAYGSYMAKNGETDYSDGIFVGYRHFDKKNIEPLFPFGYGLSYTKFVYSNLKIEGTGDSYKLSFDIKNTGKVKGAEAAQVYVAAENAGVDNPVKQLKGFGRVTLKPGENKMVAVSLPADSFSSYDESKHEWVVNPGKYDVLVGASSRDIKLKGNVTIP